MTRPNVSTRPAADLARCIERIDELETRIAFQEDLLGTLNDVVARQDQAIDRQQRLIEALEEQLKGLGDAGASAQSTHEPPPHY